MDRTEIDAYRMLLDVVTAKPGTKTLWIAPNAAQAQETLDRLKARFIEAAEPVLEKFLAEDGTDD